MFTPCRSTICTGFAPIPSPRATRAEQAVRWKSANDAGPRDLHRPVARTRFVKNTKLGMEMNRVIAAAAVCLCVCAPAFAQEPDGLVLPAGFHASVVADGLKGVRHLAFRDQDTL